jgi:hypothetical protein
MLTATGAVLHQLTTCWTRPPGPIDGNEYRLDEDPADTGWKTLCSYRAPPAWQGD